MARTTHRGAAWPRRRFLALCGGTLGLGLLGGASSSAAPPTPHAPLHKPLVLFGGTVYPVAAKPIEGGQVLVREGKIVAVGKTVESPADAVRQDCTGLHLYPALFDAWTDVGLAEVLAVRATLDTTEVGPVNPEVEARTALNPDSDLIPVARSAGVALVLTVPQGPLVAGQSAVLQLDGWTPEDLVLASPAGLHLRWPRLTPQRFKEEPEATPAKQRETRDQGLRELDKLFEQAKAYRQAVEAGLVTRKEPRFEALLPVLKREVPVIVTAEEADEIRAAVAFCRRESLRMVLHGGYAADECLDLLSEDKIPVMVFGVHRLPRSPDDPYDRPFTLPAKLHAAGIRFCITSNDGPAHVRNLPYQAGTAIAHGLPEEAALAAVTAEPARILGVANRVGTLEVGKDATFVLMDRPVFSGTANVVAAWIRGWPTNLDDRQKILRRKYEEKLRRGPDR